MTNTLVMPFLESDPLYAYGVEFGMLYVRMRDTVDAIADFFTRANQDQILLAASRLGWHVEEIREHDEYWFWCRMAKS